MNACKTIEGINKIFKKNLGHQLKSSDLISTLYIP